MPYHVEHGGNERRFSHNDVDEQASVVRDNHRVAAVGVEDPHRPFFQNILLIVKITVAGPLINVKEFKKFMPMEIGLLKFFYSSKSVTG